MYKLLCMRITPMKISASIKCHMNKKGDLNFGLCIERPSYSKNPAGEVYKERRIHLSFWHAYAIFSITRRIAPAGSWAFDIAH